MTKLEAWHAWSVVAHAERLSSQFTLDNSSHGKAFSFAWDAAVKAEREKVARWMIERSYATGHGDTIEDLLKELEWQVSCVEPPPGAGHDRSN